MNMKFLNKSDVCEQMERLGDGPLGRIALFIESRRELDTRTLWIPEIWNTCGYDKIIEQNQGEILVPAYAFLSEHIRSIYDHSLLYSFKETIDLKESVIYSLLIRYTTAWDYDHDGHIEFGTFLKTLLLLPLLKQMGVNILYMLPITRYSTMNLKGDIGSPYAVQSMFDLDPNLHDPLLDDMEQITLNDEMSALVEACHLLDMKVVVDFIPRVTARNSDLIRENPEWVYWIRKEALTSFAPPLIPELGFFEECTPDKLETVYRSEQTAEFLQQFTQPPNVLNPMLWEELKRLADETGQELLELVEQSMGITTAPAHSDWINDVQPIWTDITFLRLYSDVSPQVKPFISPDQAPYVLFDTIKCNYYPAEQPNRELWDLLLEGIRYNLQTYNVDGFRIDIGHVLPVPLLEEMVSMVRAIKPHALLISEDLFNRNHDKAAAVGYDIMLGSGWNIMADINKTSLVQYLKELPYLNIYIFACAETADTPRITSRGGVKLARMIGVFNHFLPNAIPFIATGYEMNEEQPMNCGLGDNTNGADIPRAFFNRMKIDWSHSNSMIPLLSELQRCKIEWQKLLNPEHFFVADSPNNTVVYGYMQNDERFLACFNLSPDEAVEMSLEAFCTPGGELFIQIDSLGNSKSYVVSNSSIVLQPLQAVILGSRKRLQ